MTLLPKAVRPHVLCTAAASLFALASFAPAQAPAGSAEDAAAKGGKAQGRAQLPAQLVVGIVDIGKVVVQYPLYIDLNKQLEAKKEERMAELSQLEQQIEELRGTINVVEAGDDRDRAQFQLKMQLQLHEFKVQSFNNKQRIEQDRVLLRVYQDIDLAIAKVAQKQGVALVLRKLEIPPSVTAIDDMDPREVKARVDAYESRKVWFGAEELDITGDVIKRLQFPLEREKAAEGDKKTADDSKNGGAAAPSKDGGE